MTEAEWMVCLDPDPMLEFFLLQEDTDRKTRLFVCGWCRHFWERLTEPDSRRAVEVAEWRVDWVASIEEVLDAEEAAERAIDVAYQGGADEEIGRAHV